MSSTKILKALETNKDWNIVEATREFGNREYNESGVAVGVPQGPQRVKSDVRYIGTDPANDDKIRPIVRSSERISKIAKRYQEILKSGVFMPH